MKVIKDICERIEYQIDSAENAIKMAIDYKQNYPDAAKALYNVASIELDSISSIHNSVVQIINKYKEENGEPPEPMMAVYEYLHKRQIEKTTKVRTMMELYRQG